MSYSTPPIDELPLRASGATAVVFGATLARFVLRVVSTVILARLLVPEDFGLFAMAIAFTGILAVFRDAGLSQATVQHARLDDIQVSTLFWTNLAMGVALLLAGAMLAPFVAWLFQEPRLLPLTLICASVYLVAAPAVQHLALLRRQMSFSLLMGLELGGAITSLGVAVVCAYAGAGYWSLAVGQVAGAAVLTVGSWQACRWRPKRVFDARATRALLAFGANLTLSSLADAVARRFDNILVGWQAGAHALGLYSRAFQLLLLPLQQAVTPMSSVALSTLSRLQSDPEAYRRQYLRLVAVIAYLTMPAVALLFALADPLVLLLLGPVWAPVAMLYSVLAPAALIQPVVATASVVYQSRGESARLRNWRFTVAVVQCAAFVAGLPFGPLGVAAAYSAVTLCLALPTLRHALAGTDIATSEVLGRVWRPLAASALVAGLGRLTVAWMDAAPVPAIAAGLAVAGVSATFITLTWTRLREDVASMLRLAGSALGSGFQARPPVQSRTPSDAASGYCLIARSVIADDPRVRKQAELLRRCSHDVVAVGFGGGLAAAPSWRLETVSPRPWKGADLDAVGRALRFLDALARVCLATLLKPLCRPLPGIAHGIFWLSPTSRRLYRCAAATNAQVYVAHDWHALPIAARLAAERGAFYCYDSHECASEQFAERALWRWVHQPYIAALEASEIRGASVVSTVSPGIAKLMQRRYGLSDSVHVVRNVPFHEVREASPDDVEQPQAPIVVLYHGAVTARRGLHGVIRSVLLWRPEFRLVVRGPVSRRYRRRLLHLVERLDLGDRVAIEPPVPVFDMVRHASRAHLGLIVLPMAGAQNRHALPNKLFEYIMAGLAVVAPSMDDIREVVEHHRVGICFPALAPEPLAAAINALDRASIADWRRNSEAAAHTLCWEIEAAPLIERYEAVRLGV